MINPVTRLAAALLLTFPLLVTLDWVSATLAVVLEVGLYLALPSSVGVPPTPRATRAKTLIKRLIPILIAAPLAAVAILLYGKPGGATYWHWGFILISEQSVAYGVAIAIRVIAIGLAVLVTLVDVDPTDMADGLAQVLRLPARFVLGGLAGARMMTALSRDWTSLALARRARGLGDTGRLKAFATSAFALLVGAIRRGSALATAMEARGFGTGSRTWARPSRVGWRDAVYLGVAVAIMVVALMTSVVTGHFHLIGAG
ncbi:MAG: energy-coupling factor transporter transmembrane protein EcfT [Propionibacteriaceae bacterium]|jgi:energy-coupling factor transport system permease protein|nr:energy-coupling factor transporter transmembrane protein EcfT [Propionibacteriaceae bacterium]